MSALISERQPGTLDRVLRVFADVRPGEGRTILLMSLSVSVL